MKLLPLLMAVCALLPLASRAEQVKLTFTAEVTHVLDGYAPLGSTISGDFVFDRDPATYNAHPSPLPYEKNATYYDYTGATYGMHVTLPSGTPDLSQGLRSIAVVDHYTDTPEPTDVAYLWNTHLGVQYELALFGPDTSFSGTALPSNDWLANGWTYGRFSIHDMFHVNNVLDAHITSFSVSAVPELSTFLLMLAGLAALWLTRRTAKREPEALAA